MIRDDLLNKIKEIFGVQEFVYIGTEKNLYSNKVEPFLIFTTDKNLIAIRKSTIENNVYHLDIVVNDEEYGYCYLGNVNHYILKMEGNETILAEIYALKTTEYRFPGKAFDFDKEFVIAALENN